MRVRRPRGLAAANGSPDCGLGSLAKARSPGAALPGFASRLRSGCALFRYGRRRAPAWFAVWVLAMSAGAAHAQATPPAKPCSAPEHRQFDFWVGEWTVTTPDGKHAGDNRIEKILGGCALQESWTGAGGGGGFSYNAWDARRKVWHQTWVDAQGNLLLLEGGLRDGAMVLADGAEGVAKNRITWTARKDGSVRQLWESSADGGKTWKAVFDGLYRKK